MNKGDRIKARRETMGLSQVEVAERLKISKQLYYKYENNIVTNIPSDKIEALADILDVTPQYIMGWTEHSADNDRVGSAMWDLAKDKDLMGALKVYNRMSPDKKKRVVDLIHLIGAE